jgi:hypothetical protein
MKKQILLLALSAIAVGVASANPSDHHGGRFPDGGRSPPETSNVVPAPELDPRSMIAGLTLLTGVAMVLIGRRRIKSS